MIKRHKNNTFYVVCDSDCCGKVTDLVATDFSAATREAKEKGYMIKRSKDGLGWVNFCGKFCEICYNAPQITIKKK